MDLKQLYYFKVIAEEGNILKASKKLYMSQPPLSMQMKDLENELGCLLFERGSRQIKLTDEGMHLYKRCLDIFDLVSITKEEIGDISKGDVGTLRIGIVSSLTNSFVTTYIKEFLEKYNNVSVEIFEANTYDLIGKLKDKLLDFAFVRSPYDEEEFENIDLRCESLVAISKDKLSDSDVISIKDILDKDIITYRRWKNIIDHNLDSIKLRYKIINDDARTTVTFVNMGLGIGIVPESAKVDGNLNVYKIKDLDIESEIRLIYLKDGYISNIGHKFLGLSFNVGDKK